MEVAILTIMMANLTIRDTSSSWRYPGSRAPATSKANENIPSTLDSLPDELVLLIAEGLNQQGLMRLSRVSRKFRHTAQAVLYQVIQIKLPSDLFLLLRSLSICPALGVNVKSLQLMISNTFVWKRKGSSVTTDMDVLRTFRNCDRRVLRCRELGVRRSDDESNLMAEACFGILNHTPRLEALGIGLHAVHGQTWTVAQASRAQREGVVNFRRLREELFYYIAAKRLDQQIDAKRLHSPVLTCGGFLSKLKTVTLAGDGYEMAALMYTCFHGLPELEEMRFSNSYMPWCAISRTNVNFDGTNGKFPSQ